MLEEKLDELDELLNRDEPHGKRKSLGRGLGALLGDDDLEEPNLDFDALKESDKVDINKIKASPFQPRTEFNAEALQSLAESVKEKGILQPLLVRKKEDGYELIAGERRLRAAKSAGLTEVPVIIKEMSDGEVLEVALVENLLRENLSAIEEAEGLQRLMNEFSHTQEALSKIIGKSRSYIANTLRLLNLPNGVQDMIKEGKISAGHARTLVGLENAEAIAQEIISKDLSVRQTEELVAGKKDAERPQKAKKAKDLDLLDIEKDLNETLGLRIKITPNAQGGGKVVLQYASAAELDMIVDILEKKHHNTTAIPDNKPDSQTEKSEKFTIKMID